MSENSARGFPGMLGSIDCYNWSWKNCPKANQGQYRGNKGTSVVLEAVASKDLWIWHCFFGLPGSFNDINVFQRSHLLRKLESGTMHHIEFELNGKTYTQPYWLADGIYPNLPVFAKSIKDPQGASKQYYAKRHESLRKDIERAFGVLQARFAIVKNPSRQWRKASMTSVMQCCIILHNMIVEDERDDRDVLLDTNFLPAPTGSKCQTASGHVTLLRVTQNTDVPSNSVAALVSRVKSMQSSLQHNRLRNDLIEHLWKRKGDAVTIEE
jgi:hypothetical protein